MEFKYAVHYHDNRLSNPYRCIEIKTSNIEGWVSEFEANNAPYVTVMERYPVMQ